MRARTRAGSPAMGMVMTLIIVVPDEDAEAARQAAPSAPRASTRPACSASSSVTAAGPPRSTPVGTGDGWGGETALIRLRGEVVRTPSPWCCRCCCRTPRWRSGGRPSRPADPADDPLGALAQRRITDSAAVHARQVLGHAPPVPGLRPRQHRPELDPPHAVARAPRRGPGPAPREGDARVGLGRADQPQRRPARGVAQRPPAVPVERHTSDGPGITKVVMDTKEGPDRASPGRTVDWRRSPPPTGPTDRSP